MRRPAMLLALALTAAAGLAQSRTQSPALTPLPRAADVAVTRPSLVHTEPTIEVVFVLDTTGSMSGLLEGAKQKIWAIANQIALAKPRPTIRMGLVGYRDRGDDYITTSTPLTDDLDKVYTDLMAYSANGGGDGPESVNQALHEAVTAIDWTPRDDTSSTLRIIYLVGDAPPHMDYDQDIKYHASCEQAAKRGIIINTIQCGGQTDTTPIWQEIARLAEGEYFAIEQSGGVVAIATPYDAQLAELSGALSGTLLAYGTPDQQAELENRRDLSQKIAEAAPATAAAERASYLGGRAGGGTLAGRQELVRDLAEGDVKLEELPDDQLPPELRELPAGERQAYIDAKAAERTSLQARIAELSTRRQEFIQQEMTRLGAGDRDAFDQKVVESLRAQAARVGITYD